MIDMIITDIIFNYVYKVPGKWTHSKQPSFSHSTNQMLHDDTANENGALVYQL